MTEREEKKLKLRKEVKAVHDELNALRMAKENPVDVTIEEYVSMKYGMDFNEYLKAMDINPGIETVSNILNSNDVVDVRWIVPEVFRSALRKGYRKAPIYPNIIRTEEQLTTPSVIIPHINMSDAAPRKVAEGETIPLGSVSFGSRKYSMFKIGRGISLTDEIKRYSTINFLSIYLQDFGVLLGQVTDYLAVECLINGEQKDGSESAPVIGVDNPSSGSYGGMISYRDLLRVAVRAGRLGRSMTTMIGGENAALDILNQPEFSMRYQGTTEATLNIKSPIPKNFDFFIHGIVDNNQVIMLDKSAALLKLNGMPLKVESERIVSNQTEAFYASLETGFAKMYRDGSVIIDKTKNINDFGFPDYMDIDPYMMVELKN